ncbi:restriction endonuclease fold toxin-2 domain-containing protein [Kitasatospora sp. NPDC050463]|uniref:restriction endonuclease fold toxin-2 domain-containing protein n=1 Tax=Kitasatospora sp. NPDC050463 TaxID=3155786 RepID=UPI0033D0CE38
MSGFHVKPSDMLVASGGFSDLQAWAGQIYQGLVGSLDAVAGMAGDDDAGKKFAAKYDPAAQKLVDAMAQVVAQLGGTANGLYTMAVNYVRTDADIAAKLMSPQKLPASSTNPQCDQEPVRARIQSAAGHSGSGVVHDILAKFWPQADPTRLRQAAKGWKRLAELISRLGTEGDKRVQKVTASSTSGAVDSFAANWAKVHDGCATSGPLLNSITNAAYKLGTACEAYAQAVEDLRDTLEDLAIAAGVVAGAGIALTVFTLGISDAAAAGGEAALVAEAGTAAVAMTAAIEGSAELAVLAEAAAIVEAAEAALIPVGAAATAAAMAGTAVVLAGATDAMAAAKPPVVNTVTPGLPPLPPEPNSAYKDLTPAQQAQVTAWMAEAEAATDPRRSWTANDPLNASKAEEAERRRYQIRVAGSTEYSLYTTLDKPDGSQFTMNADGIRPQDGAAVDSKYIGQKPGCKSPLRLENVDNVFPIAYENVLAAQTWEASRYASAFQDPRNEPINHLEVITNDEKAAAYFDAIMAAESVPGRTRIEK